MALFQFRWLRRLMRRRTNRIPEYDAAIWKQRLSIAYMLLAWNAIGLVTYMMFTGRKDWAEYYGYKTEEDKLIPPGVQWAKTLKVDQAKIVRFSGLTKISEIDYQKEENSESTKTEELKA